jgi:hypothetical protein
MIKKYVNDLYSHFHLSFLFDFLNPSYIFLKYF